MRIHPSPVAILPVSVTSEPPRPRTYSTESVLVSPFAPSLPSVARFLSWLWSYIRPLFTFFIPKKEPEPAPTPSPEVFQALAHTKHRETPAELPKWAIPSLLVGGAGLIYWQGRNIVSFATELPGKIISQVPTIIANAVATGTVNRGHKLVEQLAQKTFSAPSWMLKSASFTLTSCAVWYSSAYFGYPMGGMFLGFLGQFTFPPGSRESIIASIGFGSAASYIEPEKLFWVVTAFNTARLAQQAPTSLRRIDVQRSFLT